MRLTEEQQAKLVKLRAHVAAFKGERRGTDQLLPYARNSRKHSAWQVKQVAASLLEFGWTNPVLIGPDDTIIAGHARVMAALELDLPEVPVIVLAHLTEAQRRAYVIADNALAESASWDDDMLGIELRDLQHDVDLTLLGLDEDRIRDLLAEPAPGGGAGGDGGDPDAVPSSAPARVKRGEVWLLGAYLECDKCKHIVPYAAAKIDARCPKCSA